LREWSFIHEGNGALGEREGSGGTAGSARSAAVVAAGFVHDARPRAVEAEQLAWIAAVPCAALTVAAIVLLGPPLGRALFAPGAEAFWQGVSVRPEPTEHARYAIALFGPFLLSAAVLVASVRRFAARPATARILALPGPLALVSALVLSLLAQYSVLLHANVPPVQPNKLFNEPTLAAAGALALLALVVPRRQRAAAWIARCARETRGRRLACLLLAATLTAIWLLTALNTDGTIGRASGNNLIEWDIAETFGVLDGRTPLVDLHAQYSQLWPYVAAAAMAVFGATIGTWTIVMALISGLAMVTVYAVLRTIVRSSPLALALYIPFLATSFFMALGPPDNRIGPANIFSLWPLRYAGPYFVAGLAARHASRRAGPAWPLLVAAGLVAINNAEFGIAAWAATLVALAYRVRPRTWRPALRLAAEAAAGTVMAAALVALLTLARTGELPHFGLVVEFSRFYGLGGWVLEAMSPMGVHIAIYLTFTAAIVVATVRAVRGGDERTLTSMLAWSGVFGLIASSYYVGRSDTLNLIALFSAWAFSLTLLVVVVVRRLAARSWRRPQPAEIAVLVGFGIAICSVPQIPTPWSQIARLGKQTATPAFQPPATLRFVRRLASRGENVALLIPLGHRIAYDLGLVDVAPYASLEAMPTQDQMRITLDAVRSAHAHTIVLARPTNEQVTAVSVAGFSLRAQQDQLYAFSDRAAR
jgi:hypothetical protein